MGCIVDVEAEGPAKNQVEGERDVTDAEARASFPLTTTTTSPAPEIRASKRHVNQKGESG